MHTEKDTILNEELTQVSPNGNSSRFVVVGAVSVGFLLFLMGMDEQYKALALGPEGPLVEEFWDNVRRYALYALTVLSAMVGVSDFTYDYGY
ncbi:hypothetical protein GH714_016395 [Hevea brasiliensis]|uniref:Uncharacterized protein n=1 Tax=Hevea brasiliensis TaxID=3981 RepID=A0A6A6KK53_HEVBR|nr:hypothetical protein GH714_016395 [Hevea brasiliensis]